jgi:hypothetical protein
MGIAKNIEAYAVNKNYTTNTDKFIKYLSDKLHADFVVNIYDKELNQIGVENILTTFNKQDRYRLSIFFDDYNINGKICSLPTYQTSIPINFVYEKSIELTFYPNHSVYITFLTFEHLWVSLINTLKFKTVYESRDDAIARYEILRKEYCAIFKKIDIAQIFIVTHAHYNIEDLTATEVCPKLTYEKIIEVAQTKDNFTIFDFKHILDTKEVQQLDDEFINTPDLEIMLLDNLQW